MGSWPAWPASRYLCLGRLPWPPGTLSSLRATPPPPSAYTQCCGSWKDLGIQGRILFFQHTRDLPRPPFPGEGGSGAQYMASPFSMFSVHILWGPLPLAAQPYSHADSLLLYHLHSSTSAPPQSYLTPACQYSSSPLPWFPPPFQTPNSAVKTCSKGCHFSVHNPEGLPIPGNRLQSPPAPMATAPNLRSPTWLNHLASLLSPNIPNSFPTPGPLLWPFPLPGMCALLLLSLPLNLCPNVTLSEAFPVFAPI